MHSSKSYKTLNNLYKNEIDTELSGSMFHYKQKFKLHLFIFSVFSCPIGRKSPLIFPVITFHIEKNIVSFYACKDFYILPLSVQIISYL